jgi:flagellar assembly protein FliH
MSSSKKNTILPNVPSPQGSKASSVYGRFIPKEELENVSNWNPNMFGSDQPRPTSGVHRAGPSEPKAPPADPAEELANLMRSTRQQGYQDGYRDGMAALEAFKQTFASQISAQMGALTQSLMAQLDDLQQDMARALATSATHLARQVVRSELTTRPELIAQVAEEALGALLLSAKHITIRVNPNDHALVLSGAADVLTARGARLVSDASIARGGCVVESDIGVIDASLPTRWRRAAAALGIEQSWQAQAQEEPEITTEPEMATEADASTTISHTRAAGNWPEESEP